MGQNDFPCCDHRFSSGTTTLVPGPVTYKFRREHHVYVGGNSFEYRQSAQRLIRQYFQQLTQGCGYADCTNSYCSNGRDFPIDPTEAATLSLVLATRGISKLCARPALGSSTIKRVQSPGRETFNISITGYASSDRLRYDVSGHPEACPISSLDAALKWIPGCDDLCVPSIPLTCSVQPPLGGFSPRILVCHDMMGGYQKDRFVQGHSELEDYYFYHWQNVEGFIYFSHHFLSIPPPCWTNAAHRNGRLSLATLITEWKDGAKVCATLLSSKEKVIKLVNQMVMMAQYYRFDGWLVNIENHINPPLMDHLYMFLSLLTTGMHSVAPRSKVIWYDSVTVDGNLKWQNALNKLNQPFFDMCDGIFLNYLWELPQLQASATLAADRRTDVYVGVDVFGRKCYGGGGYNTHKALAVIKQASLSAAVFAPGWVYETQPKPHFFKNQDKFWLLLDPYCAPGEPHTPPIISSFSRGCGEKVFIDGTLVHCGHWSNISAQDLQPSFFTNILRNNTKSGVYLESCDIDNSVAYYGGSNLRISGKLISPKNNIPGTARLFRTSVNSAPLLISYSVLKNESRPSILHFLQLQCTSNVLLLDPDTHCTGKGTAYGLPVSGELCIPKGWPTTSVQRLGALPSPLSDYLHLMFTGNEHSTHKWKTEYFIVSQDHMKGPVSTVGLAIIPCSSSEIYNHGFTLNLGEIKILDLRCVSPQEKQSYIENLHFTDLVMSVENTQFSLTLKWNVVNNPLDPITHCNIYAASLLANSEEVKTPTWKGICIYRGQAYANCFRLCGTHVLSNDLRKQLFGLELRVQSVTSTRRKSSVDNADSLTVWFYP